MTDEKAPKTTLLLVDDDRLILSTVAEGLRDAGFTVLEASTGEAALKLARENSPDLAICDVRMPGMSGLELAPRLLGWEHTLLIRRCKKTLTPEQSAEMTKWALAQDGKRYALGRLLLQATPVRCRGARPGPRRWAGVVGADQGQTADPSPRSGLRPRVMPTAHTRSPRRGRRC